MTRASDTDPSTDVWRAPPDDRGPDPVRIGRYELVRLLGSGGQGRVYEAVLHGPGGFRKPVALKLLDRAGGGLVREARLGGLLRHPNLVDVYEVGEEDGIAFAAMELCRGGSLAQQALPLPPRAVVDVGLAVCAALQYAHETLGLVHRDLKPQNLLLDGATVKVADLGVASADGFPIDLGRVSGTVGYMPREQRLGAEVDARADVYALGVVLHVLSTGVFPGQDETLVLDEDTSITLDQPVPLPNELAPILDRCLRPAADERYASMAELADALRGLDASGDALAAVLGVWAPRAERGGAVELPELLGRGALLPALLERCRAPGLALLKGPGGVGKTRLARELERRSREGGRRVVWVDLAEATTGLALLKAVASALDVSLGGGDEGRRIGALGSALAALGPALIVLDNLEQLPSAGAALARWRELAPEATLLATSRERLHVGETVVEVEVLDRDASIALLRARALDRGVEVADEAALARIAERLDGLPLALELAAGRLGVLTAAEVAERLSLSLLRSGRADRTGTLRATLEWSFELLDEDERSVLAQLSVFRGGFTLEAAEAVIRPPDRGRWVVDLVGSLVDRSLVRAREGARFDLLPSVAELAGERLGDPGPVRDRHARYFATMDLAALEDRARVPAISTAIMLDRDNWSAAVEHATAAGQLELAAAGLALVWFCARRRGPFEESLRLGAALLARPELVGRHRGRAAGVAGSAARYLGRFDEARALMEEAWAASLADGDVAGCASHAGNLGVVARDLRDPEATARWFGEALTLSRAVRDRTREAITLVNLGTSARDGGRPDEARRLYDEALEVARRAGDRYSEGVVQGMYGVLDALAKRTDDALARMEFSLRVHREFGDQLNVGHALGNLATTLARTRPAEALPLLLEALASHRSLAHARGEGIVLAELGQVYEDLGDRASALEHHRAAVVVLRRLGDEEGVKECLDAIARLEAAG